MTRRLAVRQQAAFRAFIAAAVFCGIAFAVALSAAPRLHDTLHNGGDRTSHECAATLLSGGNVEHTDCEPPSAQPADVPSAPAFRLASLPVILAALEFSRLEHAPPVLS